MVPHILSGEATAAGAGAEQLTINVQSDTWCEDLTFTQTAGAGGEITSIMFGDETVFNNPSGVDVDIFKADSTLRKWLKGRKIKAGQTITIATSFAAAGTVKAVIVGKRQIQAC